MSDTGSTLQDEPSTDRRSQARSMRRSSESGRRSSGHRGRRSSRSLLPMVALTVVAAVAIIVLMVYLFGTIARYSSENTQQRTELSQKETELRDARAELRRAQAQFDTLVKERLPNVKALEFDKVIPLSQGFVRNVIFTETHSGDKIGYEYKLVVENKGQRPVVPQVRVLMFDRTGIQIGGATVKDVPLMRTGDSGSFTGEMDIFMDAAPAYFHVESKSD